jgi:hypothetical protein
MPLRPRCVCLCVDERKGEREEGFLSLRPRCVCVCVYVCVCEDASEAEVCVYLCVCMREREREREGSAKKCVVRANPRACVCERERERESESVHILLCERTSRMCTGREENFLVTLLATGLLRSNRLGGGFFLAMGFLGSN